MRFDDAMLKSIGFCFFVDTLYIGRDRWTDDGIGHAMHEKNYYIKYKYVTNCQNQQYLTLLKYTTMQF